MGRRRGAVNVLLLFLMMGLTAVAGALLAMTVRSLTAVCSYENGLCAVYAAESGAQYGLSLLEREGVPQNQVIESPRREGPVMWNSGIVMKGRHSDFPGNARGIGGGAFYPSGV